MKIRLTLSSLLAAVAFCAAAPAVHAQIKVATVDMNKVFSGYYKTKDAENKINDAREVAKKELDDRMESHKQMLDEINQLNKDIDNPALSASAKSDRSKKRDDKIAGARQLEQEINEFKTSREKQLQEQAVRMRNQIVEEIMTVINDKVKDESIMTWCSTRAARASTACSSCCTRRTTWSSATMSSPRSTRTVRRRRPRGARGLAGGARPRGPSVIFGRSRPARFQPPRRAGSKAGRPPVFFEMRASCGIGGDCRIRSRSQCKVLSAWSAEHLS